MLRRLLIVMTALVTGVGLVALSPAAAPAAPAGARGSLVSVKDITDQKDARMGQAAKVFEVVYLSEDVHGELVPVHGSVSVPKRAARAGGYRILAWNHSTVGLGDTCGLSTVLGEGGKRDPWLGKWLDDGYVIAASDYAGIDGPGVHAYLHGPTAAKNTLDMIRATRTVVAQYAGAPISEKFLSFGGSQGGHTALWTSNLAEDYAPELTDVGTVAHSVPVYLDDYFATIEPGFPPVAVPDLTTYFTYVLAGLKQARPDVPVDSYLNVRGRSLVKKAETLCYREMGQATKGVPVGELVSRPLREGSLMAALRDYSRIPVKGYTAPILLQQGTADTVAFQPLTVRFADELRANGAKLEYREYPEQHGLSTARVNEARAWANGLPGWGRS